MTGKHSFHIPVMGIGYTIDTPLKVSQFGIDSVIFISEDILLEKLRKAICDKYGISYTEITEKTEDYRAKRITSYLNLINDLSKKKFEDLKNSTLDESRTLRGYFNMLPDGSYIKQKFEKLKRENVNLDEFAEWIKENLSMGSIDVNIMTKLDRENYRKEEQLPVEYNNAHAALRGYANSELNSSMVFSAGMNPRLFSYIAQFDDFYPDKDGNIRKKIILKVSDYRSALIQGKFLAKKGIWVSEYRVESGLNCGGHAFPTDGYLMGPILAEFKNRREELIESIHEILIPALVNSDRTVPKSKLPLKITAQGGVGTAEEHQFILDHYEVDSVGWGTPFLLVPEATTVDESTMDKLIDAKEDDLYLSNISPLGIPFNNLKGNSKDLEKLAFIDKGRPGSACPKKFLSINKEFTDRSICTASRQYQHAKLNELEERVVTPEEFQKEFDQIVEKTCLCVGLGASALKVYNVDNRTEGEGVSICPGPNMAYFSKKMSLSEITDHIYGRSNMITRTDRPNMFIKELEVYIDFLKSKIEETRFNVTNVQMKYLLTFVGNLNEGIEYYHTLFSGIKDKFEDAKHDISKELGVYKNTLHRLQKEIENFAIPEVVVA
jgi:hypothetical protein